MKQTQTAEVLTGFSDLVKKESCYNPMFLNDNKISHVVFFDPDKGTEILPQYDLLKWFGSNNNYPLIRLPFEFKKKNAADLSLKYAYYMSYKDKYFPKDKLIVLYIPITLMDEFKDLGEKLEFETDTEKNFKHWYSFKVMAQVEELDYNKEEDKFTYSTSELKETEIKFSGYYRIEKKPLGHIVDKITAKIKEVIPDTNISGYDVERMLEVLNITIK